MIKEVMHIGITVSNLDNSVKFYRDIMGLEYKGEIFMEGKETEILFDKKNCKARVCYLNGSNEIFAPSIELIEFIDEKSKEDKAMLNKTSISEICFSVEDIDKTYKRMSKLGVSFISEPQLFDFTKDGFGKSKAVYFKDPDGIILELMEVCE